MGYVAKSGAYLGLQHIYCVFWRGEVALILFLFFLVHPLSIPEWEWPNRWKQKLQILITILIKRIYIRIYIRKCRKTTNSPTRLSAVLYFGQTGTSCVAVTLCRPLLSRLTRSTWRGGSRGAEGPRGAEAPRGRERGEGGGRGRSPASPASERRSATFPSFFMQPCVTLVIEKYAPGGHCLLHSISVCVTSLTEAPERGDTSCHFLLCLRARGTAGGAAGSTSRSCSL